MLKVGSCKCLLKNFQNYKCLKYGKYSTGSGNDQNDNDNFDTKNKDNKTDSTTKKSNVKGLEYIFNNLLVNQNKPENTEAYQKINLMKRRRFKKEMTALEKTTLKEYLSKCATKTGDVNESDTHIQNKNTGPDSRTKVKSSNSTSLENFKNLLSSCKVEILKSLAPRKKSLEEEMSTSDYLKLIFDVVLILRDNKMEGDKEPIFIGKQDTKEYFMKLISEIVIGSSTKVSVNFDTIEKSFISMSVPTMRLNIFRKIDSETQTEKENSTSIIDLIESHEYRKMNSNIPTSYFHECIQLTRDKIMRSFPIDNEQDSEELNIGFHQHVFPQQYLTGTLPNTGVIGQYMNYVCMGLSQNPHLTVEQKKAHIKWFEEYLSNKQEEINLATKKIKDDFEYEKSLRNK